VRESEIETILFEFCFMLCEPFSLGGDRGQQSMIQKSCLAHIVGPYQYLNQTFKICYKTYSMLVLLQVWKVLEKLQCYIQVH